MMVRGLAHTGSAARELIPVKIQSVMFLDKEGNKGGAVLHLTGPWCDGGQWLT
jgi:hypothetical protein